MPTIRIEVTAEDIKAGWRRSSQFCPVAIAIRWAVGPELDVQVGSDEIFVGEHVIPTPLLVDDFITRVDLNQIVEPFAFDLDVPEELLATLPGEGEG
jgi:hypothetical protein